MAKIDSIKCKFGIHKYEVYKEEELTDVRRDVIGKVIISRCTIRCKIHVDKVRTVENY